MPIDVSAKQLLRLRLASQLIHAAQARTPTGVVPHMLAMQAQDFAQALWAVGLRSPGSTRSSVLGALERGDVVRSLPMRGTLHFVPAEDLGWMLSLTSARTLHGATTRFRNLGLEPETLEHAYAVVERELRGGGRLARDEFMKLIAANGIAPDGQRGYHVIFSLAQRQLICWGPPAGTQQALVLNDEWITNPRELDRDASLKEFAVRYFASHGPATERDLAWWTKLTMADVRAAIAAAASELTELRCGQTSYWIATSALGSGATSRAVHALPGFDEYLLGYGDRSAMLADEHFQRIVPGNNGMFLPMIVAKGRVVGTWRRGPKHDTITPDHFEDATPAELASFAKAAKRYTAFMHG
jgi:hypothetical protein